LIAAHMGGVGWETPVNQVTDFATQPPLKPAERQADYLAGYTGATAAMCALFQRKQTGRGQHVDTSMWLAMVSMFRPAVGIHSHESPTAPYGVRIRTRAKLGVPWVYPCKDGWVSYSPMSDRFWSGTKIAMGNPEWAESELFESLMARATNHDAVEASLIDWLAGENKQDVFKKAQAQHVPCFPVHTPREVAENEQYKAREFFVEHDHPAARVVRMPGAPCVFSRTPWQLRRGAPRLGEHNGEILGERLGVSADELATMRREGII
jgi:crotonobetainyl-CoA:carnitine CoA-transferase CaiB-like acyl-CoA transferase